MKKSLVYLAFMFIMIATCLSQLELSVIYPKNEAYKQNQAFQMHFSVYNASGGNLGTGMVACTMMIYNETNAKIYYQNLSFDADGVELVATLNSTYSERIGSYPYLVQCFSSSQGQGGFVSTQYHVTKDGSFTENDYSLAIAILSGLMMVAIFFLGKSYVISMFGSPKDKTTMLQIMITLFGVWMLPLFAHAMNVIASSGGAGVNLVSFTDTLYIVVLIMAIVITTFTFIIAFINMLMWLGVDVVGRGKRGGRQ